MIPPTLFAYYLICKRKAWLFANGINMEQTSDTVYEGKIISETTYNKRSAKYTELDLGVAKIDFFDAKNKVVHEVKKSNKLEFSHEWQVKYYLYLLAQIGVTGATGIIEYPKLKKTKEVFLSIPDKSFIEDALYKISVLKQQDKCPDLEKLSICKSCSYYDFCYSNEL